MDHQKYLEEKRTEVLRMVAPICEAFGIKDYDYDLSNKDERLVLNNEVSIGCKATSLERIKTELVGYIFVCHYKRENLGPFETQVMNQVKRYWRELV